MRKFAAVDKAYFKDRARFAAKYREASLWFIADNWPLFAGAVNIARFLAIYELAKKVVHLPGHFCELGCWNGTNLVFLAKILEILRPQSHAEVIGFDSFRGLERINSRKDGNHKDLQGHYQGNVRLLEDILKLYKLEETVRLLKGDIEKTVPVFLKERKDIAFSFIYFDTDLYSSTRTGIEHLYPKLLKGGIMAFDEFNIEDWPGETSAVREILGPRAEIKSVPFTRQPTAYVIKD